MTTFILKKNPNSGLYAVYENGRQVKSDIFTSVQDFEHELDVIGFNQPHTTKVEA